MKKFLCISVLVVMLASMLTACGKFECGICKEEKTGKKYKETFLGEKVDACKDCHEKLEKLQDAFEGIQDAFSN